MSNYPSFSQHELDCPCGCDGRMDDEFMTDVIVPMRMELGFPFIISKGGAYRCADYDGNKNHEGHALDFRANSRQRWMVIDWIEKRNRRIDMGHEHGKKVTRIGINKTTIHIDDMQSIDGKYEMVIWTYYG